MKAVINATPLIALALVNQLDVLYHLFEEVLVPPVVYDEVTNQGSRWLTMVFVSVHR